MRSPPGGPPEAIAVIGMACRFPGDVDTPQGFWHLLERGVCTAGPIPANRWNTADFYHPTPGTPGKIYAQHGSFIRDLRGFDCDFFGIAPREAETIDPQQRMLLEVAWWALEDAGIPPSSLRHSRTGVFAGAMNQDVGRLVAVRPSHHRVTGNANSAIAGRVSYTFGLRGPSVVNDAACSSSLVAIDMGRRALLDGSCDLALCGGVHNILHPSNFVWRCQARMLSPSGRCHTFDQDADGYLAGEGCGVIVLKRLKDAVRDGDRVHAVVLGSATRHDGNSQGFTVPDGPSQAALIRDVLAEAQVSPESVQVMEAHGTGTPVGDPIEMAALREVFVAPAGQQASEQQARSQDLVVGSVKANIGHLEASAGVASVIKAVLALQHGQIPPHIGMRTPNPNIDFEGIQIAPSDQALPWPNTHAGPRRIGVSSFGIAGTTAHVLLEQRPSDLPQAGSDAAIATTLPPIVTLSARSEASLGELQHRTQALLQNATPQEQAQWGAASLVGRELFAHRSARVVARIGNDGGDETPWLRAQPNNQGAAAQPVFVFTGQGSQFVGMGQHLYECFAVFRQAVDACAAIADPLLDQPLLEVMFRSELSASSETNEAPGQAPSDGPGADEPIHQTAFAQPAIFTVQYALCQLWASWGIQPAAVLGHSVGEFAAACAAGLLALEQALTLVLHRGRLMQALPARGAMLAVFAPADEPAVQQALAPHAAVVDIAAINTPEQTVLSGDEQAIATLAAALTASDIKSTPLRVSHAFHSPLMAPMLDGFEEVAKELVETAPETQATGPSEARCPFYSAVDGTLLPASELTPTYWRRNTREGVRFAAAVTKLHQDGYQTFVEVGPAAVLTPMVMHTLARVTPAPLAVPSVHRRGHQVAHLAEAAATLFVHGAPLSGEQHRAVLRPQRRLPNYPFTRQDVWAYALPKPDAAGIVVEQPTAANEPSVAPQGDGLRRSHAQLRLPVAGDTHVFEGRIDAHTLAAVAEHQVGGLTVVPGALYCEMALDAAAAVFADTPVAIAPLRFLQLLPFALRDGVGFQTHVTKTGPGRGNLAIYSRSLAGNAAPEAWSLRVKGKIVPAKPAARKKRPPGSSAKKASTKGRQSSRAIYAALEAKKLFSGPSFQWLTSYQTAPRPRQASQARFAVPEPWLAGPNQHHFFAGIDAAFQLSLLSMGEGPLHLPVSIARVQRFDPPRTAKGKATQPPRRGIIERCPRTTRQAASSIDDLTIYRPNGAPWLRLEGVRYQRLSPKLVAALTAANAALPQPVPLWQSRWQPARPADVAATATAPVSAVQVVVTTADCRPWAEELTNALGQTGVAQVQLEDMRAAVAAVAAAQTDDADTTPSLRLVVAPPVLDATVSTPNGQRQLLQLCDNVRRLLQHWSINAKSCPAVLCLVDTPPGQQGPSPHPLQSMWLTLAHEFPHGFGGVLHLGSGAKPSTAQTAANLLTAGAPREPIVAIAGEALHTARLGLSATQTPAMSPATTFTVPKQGSVVITGGTGGLGLAVAQWLVERGARRLWLLARRAPGKKAQAVLAKLRKQGATVTHLRTDLGDRKQMQAAARRIGAGKQPVVGVVHAAGVLRDATIPNQSAEAMQTVWQPKVDGAQHLLTALGLVPPALNKRERTAARQASETPAAPAAPFVWLFSSVTSVLGQAGQLNYAAANATLDALATYWRKQGHLNIQSIQWGPWSDVGMAAKGSQALQHRRDRGGLPHLQPQQALASLDGVAAANTGAVGVFACDGAAFGHAFPKLAPLVADYNHDAQPASAPESASAHGDAAAAEQARQLGPQAWPKLIRAALATVLGVQNADSIDPQAPLQSLGVDSLLGLELVQRLERTLGVPLAATALFEHPSLAALTSYVMAQGSPVGGDTDSDTKASAHAHRNTPPHPNRMQANQQRHQAHKARRAHRRRQHQHEHQHQQPPGPSPETDSHG